MKTALAWIVAIACGAVLFSFFPLFHVLPLREGSAPRGLADFNARAFAEDFLATKLIAATDKATDVSELLAAIRKDPKDARARLGHSPGMSSTTYFFVKGSGEVSGIEADGVGIRISQGGKEPEVLLQTGLLFGNTVRDGTGLIDPGQFPNSQHFNDIATELNRLVETNVIPVLRKIVVPGKKLTFAGCVELEEDEMPRPLKVVPVKVE